MSPFSFARHPRAHLSALADGQLDPSRRDHVQRHIAGCAQCREEYADIRATRAALADLPEIPVSRSFTLSPEQVAGPARVTEYTPARSGLVNGLRLASAGMAIALAIMVFIDAGSGGSNDSRSMSSSEDVALDIATSTDEHRAADGDSANESALTAAPHPTAIAQATVPPASGGASGGGGTGSGTSGGTGAGSGVGGVGVAQPSDAAAAATDEVPTAPPTAESPAGSQTEGVTADAPTPESQPESDGTVGSKSAGEAGSADITADGDGGDGGLLALEVLLAVGALGALGASVWVARASRSQSGN